MRLALTRNTFPLGLAIAVSPILLKGVCLIWESTCIEIDREGNLFKYPFLNPPFYAALHAEDCTPEARCERVNFEEFATNEITPSQVILHTRNGFRPHVSIHPLPCVWPPWYHRYPLYCYPDCRSDQKASDVKNRYWRQGICMHYKVVEGFKS